MKKRTQRKTLVCLVLIVFSLAILFLQSNIAFPDGLLAFRWQERLQLIGPAKILDTLVMEQLLYDRVTIGRSDYGYTLYYWNKENPKLSDDFFYYPMDGDLTYADAPVFDMLPYMEGWEYPFFVFSEDKAATRASFQLKLTAEGKTETYELNATKQYGCLFLFCLNESVISAESFQQYMDAGLTNNDNIANIQICVYDSSGKELDSLVKVYGGAS